MKNVPRLSLWIASEFQSKAKAQLKLKPLEVFYKKVFLKISRNSQETSYVEVSFLMKLQACLQLH